MMHLSAVQMCFLWDMPACMQHCYFIPVYIAPLAGTYPFSSVCFNEFKTLRESLDLHRMSTMGGKKKD